MADFSFFPLFNSIRISLISCAVVLVLSIAAAYLVSRIRGFAGAFFDVVFMIPLVLPPTVIGFMILRCISPVSSFGSFILNTFGLRLTMKWWSAVFAVSVVIFPLMYRVCRGAFESFDENFADSARTLGLSEARIFFNIRLPQCRKHIVSGLILSFARALGEYGATSMVAGYTPGRTATVSTEVYSLWASGNDSAAYGWIVINIIIAAVVIALFNFSDRRTGRKI